MKRFVIVLAVLLVVLGFGGLAGWSFITIRVKSHFQGGPMVMGSDVFTTSALLDTVLIKGVKSTDKYLVMCQNDTTELTPLAKNDTLIVYRKGGGTSAAAWAWLRLEPQ